MILQCRSISASAVEMENGGQDCEESENKRALSVDSDAFPASHEGRSNALSCQDCFLIGSLVLIIGLFSCGLLKQQ